MHQCFGRAHDDEMSVPARFSNSSGALGRSSNNMKRMKNGLPDADPISPALHSALTQLVPIWQDLFISRASRSQDRAWAGTA